MSTATYKQHNQAEIITNIVDDNNNLVDPAYVAIKVKKPDNTIDTYIYGTSPELTKVSTGIYKLVIPVNQVGTWYYGTFDTSTTTIEEDYFNVFPSQF